MTMCTTCPQCGLTQETPADRICRGCANAIASLVAPARSVLGLGKEAAAKAIPVGARVAGVVLLLNAAANALTMIKQGPGSDPLAHHEVKGMIVDLIVSGGLLAGKANLQKWAIVRVVLGMIVFGAMFGAQKDMTSLAFQIVFSGALLLLLVSDAGKVRIGAGVALSAACLLLATAGLVQTYTGSNPAAAALLGIEGRDLARRRATEWREVRLLPVGARAPVVPARARGRGQGQRGSRSVADPPGPRRPRADHRGVGRAGDAEHLRGHAKTMDLEYYRGVFADKNHGYQVVAFATPQSFARVEPELAAMVRSFQPDCAAGSKSP